MDPNTMRSMRLHVPLVHLQDMVWRKSYCIILIDDIEKLSHEFMTLFLQVLDDGRLTDGQGRVIDFRNTVVIMTSNLVCTLIDWIMHVAEESSTKTTGRGCNSSTFDA